MGAEVPELRLGGAREIGEGVQRRPPPTWGLTTRGALAGGITGLVSAVTLVFLSRSVWVDVLGFESPVFPWEQPALFAMRAAFLAAYLFSKLDATARARSEIEAFGDQYVRAQTGCGAAAAAKH